MSSSHAAHRRSLSRQRSSASQSRKLKHRQHSIDQDEDADDLLLHRTRSQEITVAESVAVPPDIPALGIAEEEEEEEEEETLREEAGNEDGGGGRGEDDRGSFTGAAVAANWPRAVKYLVLLCAFLTSLSFGVTQVPLLYVFRLMTCDAYYEEHERSSPDFAFSFRKAHDISNGLSLSSLSSKHISSLLLHALTSPASTLPSAFLPISSQSNNSPSPDRCSLHAIESSTALAVSLLGASTTVFGLANLFLTGLLIKRIGVKPTLVINVFFPAVRLLIQNIGVEVWGNVGIVIVQCSQIVTILGGPSGYLLVLNTFITEVVEYEGRTAWLGRLTGAMMLGSALGFLLGGIVAEEFGIRAPFRLTLILFLGACVYVLLVLPGVPPAEPDEEEDDGNGSGGGEVGGGAKRKRKKRQSGLRQFFGPLAVFAPRKFVLRDGRVQTEYGSLLLAAGVFLGILATGYLPTLLQLFSTDVFGFGTRENGWLIFMYSLLRGLFLTFVFPRLISIGRRITSKRQQQQREDQLAANDAVIVPDEPSERQPLLASTQPNGVAAYSSTSPSSSAVEDDNNSNNKNSNKAKPPQRKQKQQQQQTFTFDLTYTRFSLVADGLLTLLCSFVRQGWQMYLVAAILPFAAGTGSAAKGSVLQMVGRSASSGERTDALAGVSLVENMARLSTTFAFGVVFAGFAAIGRAELVFTCNAAAALVGFIVLLMARFPPEGSRPLEKERTPTPAS